MIDISPVHLTQTSGPQGNPAVGSDQAREPSVFFDGAVFNNVLRLPIPFHPIVYVNNQVQISQNERGETDSQSLGHRPDWMPTGDVHSHSIGAGLGFDPNLFVQFQVRFGQRLGFLMDAIVDIRESLRNLSVDRILNAPSLFTPLSQDLVSAPNSPPAQTPASMPVPADVLEGPAVIPPALEAMEDKVQMQEQMASAAARSFTDQLKASRQRVLMTREAQSNWVRI
jgi:hypothetical protein